MMGWECPKCHVVHAPDVKRCVECSPPKIDFGQITVVPALKSPTVMVPTRPAPQTASTLGYILRQPTTCVGTNGST